MGNITFKTFMTNDSTVNNSTTFTQKNIFNTTPEINNGSFSVSSSAITIPEDGYYFCSFSCYFTSAVSRSNVGVVWGINNTAQDVLSASDYIRASSDHNEASTCLSIVYDLSSGDELNLYFAQYANSGIVNLVGSSSMVCIYKLQ